MTICIYYFSGTGNTAWVVERLAAHLAELGHTVTATSCEHVAASVVDPKGCDAIGICFPVHGSFAPRTFRDFLEELPAGLGRPVFVVTTAAYFAGDTAWYATRPLQDKGYQPFLLGNVVMPNNIRLPVLSPLAIPSREKVARGLVSAERKTRKLADLIHRGSAHVEGTGLAGRLLGAMQRRFYDRTVALAFRGFFSDSSCTRCGWCVQHCPVRNIELAEAGVRFRDKCILCMRCYSFCPEEAIQSTERTKNANRYPRYQGPLGKPYPIEQ